MRKFKVLDSRFSSRCHALRQEGVAIGDAAKCFFYKRSVAQWFRLGRNTGWVICAALLQHEAALADNPYSGIHDENVFRLKTPAAQHTKPSRGPLPEVRLTGITTILKGKRALLKVGYPVKPPQRPKEESYILAEGQRAGSIEVLQIDEKKALVKLNNSGVITNITFQKIIPRPAPPPRRIAGQLRPPLYRRLYR